MRTYKLILAVLMMALCFNFVSCSDDDDNGGTNPDVPKMRVTKIELKSNDQDIRATMNYVYSGDKVSNISITASGDDIPWSGSGSMKPWTFEFTYQGDKVTITQTNDNFYDYGSITDVWTLNEDGFVESSENTKCSYSNGYLQSIKVGSDVEATFTFKAGNLVSYLFYGDGYENVSYTNIPNIGGLYIAFRDDDNVYPFSCGAGDICFFSGLMGKATTNLPEKSSNGSDEYLKFSYKLDDNGYVLETSIEDHYDGKTYSWTETYTYEPCE